MKTIYFKLFLATFTILLVQGISSAQNYEGSRELSKSSAVPADVTVQMENYSADLKIYTSDENQVSIRTTVEITGSSKEEIDKVLAAIDKFEFELHGNVMEINTKFYKSMNSINNRSTMTLQNGDKVKIKDFKIRHELHIPKSAGLELDNKYSDIDLQSINGKVKFVIYSSKLNAENFGSSVYLESKYSKIKLGTISGKTDFDFYDTDVEMEACSNIGINTKYSKFEIGKAGNMEIESYDDKFNVEDVTAFSFNSKYSDFVTKAVVENAGLELYDCNVTVSGAKKVVFNGKYSDLRLGNVKSLKVDDSYDNNIFLGNTLDVQIGKSKYSQYEIDAVSSLTMDDIYDENINIGKLNADFEKLSVNGKYAKLDVDAGSVPFKVDFNIRYPKVDVPESLKITKQIKDDSNLELVGGENGGTISVKGYDMKVVIED